MSALLPLCLRRGKRRMLRVDGFFVLTGVVGIDTWRPV